MTTRSSPTNNVVDAFEVSLYAKIATIVEKDGRLEPSMFVQEYLPMKRIKECVIPVPISEDSVLRRNLFVAFCIICW